MLEFIEDTTPYFLIRRRINQYIKHIDSGSWTETEKYPPVLIICASPALEKRLTRYITKALDNVWEEELRFGLTSKELLFKSSQSDKIWLPVNDEVDPRLTLKQL